MMLCHVCRGETKTRFAAATDPQTKEVFSVLECKSCGLAETFPQPKELDPYYTDYYGGRHGFTASFRAARRLAFLEENSQSAASTKRLLDIGCGEGTFLKAAQENGWKVFGTELRDAQQENSNFEIYDSAAEVQQRFGPASFDAITMWHSLEHFRDPREALNEARELLKKDGVILIAVPNAGGFQARLFRQYWLHLDVPRHLFHFGLESLESLLNQTGFTVHARRNQEFEYDVLGISQSALNALFDEPNVFFRILTGHRPRASAFVRLANVLLGVALSAVAVPIVLLNSAVRSGGTLVVAARKSGTTV